MGGNPTPTRRKRCHAEAGCVSSRVYFRCEVHRSRCDGICEKNTEGTTLFGGAFVFFVTPGSGFLCEIEKNICPIGVRLCTRSLWNCTISFIRLWGLLVLYFRMLDEIGKPESLFSRPCLFLCEWLFCFQRAFSHSSPMKKWIAVAALAHD